MSPIIPWFSNSAPGLHFRFEAAINTAPAAVLKHRAATEISGRYSNNDALCFGLKYMCISSLYIYIIWSIYDYNYSKLFIIYL